MTATARPLWLARLSALTAALCLAAASTSLAAESGDAQKGLAYAQTNCAECHAVGADDAKSPKPKATPFQDFAKVPGLTRTALVVFLRTPHPTMPNLVVKGPDADNVIAYILSLQK